MTTPDSAPAAVDPVVGSHPHAQSGFQVRLEWGIEGALLLSDVHIAVVVDVLSFGTTVELVVSRGVEVFPTDAREDAVESLARDHGARVAGRRGASAGTITLSPDSVTEASVGALGAEPKLVLPSPNGGAIAQALAERGVTVLVGGLRNRTAVAEWVLAEQERLGDRARVAVIAAGERRASGALRPAVEDLLGAGAIVDALTTVGIDHCSPEAAAAASAFHGLRRGIGHLMSASASAEELRGAGFADDIELARQVDASSTVPVLREFGFRA